MQRRSRLLGALLLLAVPLLLIACGDDDDVDTGGGTADTTAPPTSGDDAGTARDDDPAGRTFVSRSVTEGGADKPLAGDPIRIEFGTDGTLGGSGGCNQLGGPYEIVDGSLSVGDLMMTEMACEPPALMDQDTWLAEFLSAGPTVELDGDELTLTAGDTVMVLLDREAAQPDAALIGVVWRLETIVEGSGPDGTASSVPAGVEASIELTDDATLQVDTGCNTGRAQLEVGEDTITVGPLALTRMACAGDAAAVEAAMTAVLQGEVGYEIDADVLRLTGRDGGLDFRAGG